MKQLKLIDFSRFMRQFATLMIAGIPAARSCDIMQSSQHHPLLFSLIIQLKRDLLAGKSLYTAFLSHEKIVSPLVCQLIRVGEQTGQLDECLIQIADYLENQYAFKRQIIKALFYPAFTLITAALITLGMLVIVIPRFAALFQTSSFTLPACTRWLFTFSAFIRHDSPVIFIIAAIIITAFTLLAPEKSSFQNLKKYLWRVPIMHRLTHNIFLARFIHQLAISFAAGLPLPHAIDLCIESASTLAPQRLSLQRNIQAGLPLHQVFQRTQLFPDYLIQMIKIGEESGRLEHILHHLSNKMESDIHYQLNQIAQWVEPLIMIILGVVIGGLVIAMYLPIFNLGNAI